MNNDMDSPEKRRAAARKVLQELLSQRSGDACHHPSPAYRISLNVAEDFTRLGMETAGLPKRLQFCPDCALEYMAFFNVANSDQPVVEAQCAAQACLEMMKILD